jgi:hypothetical protein
MHTQTNKQSKSVLSRLLASENITVIHDNKARTASFDVRNRVLTLPVLGEMSNELYDMIVGHEVGHALYTPYTEKDEESIKNGKPMAAAVEIGGEEHANHAMGYLNVVEDARIEKLMKEKFGGLRRDFYIGYKDLDERDFFEIRDKDVSKMGFIDRINLHYKVGTYRHNFIKFSDEEMPFIEEIDQARTFEQVIAVTKKIWEYCKDKKRDSREDGEGGKTAVGFGNGSGNATSVKGEESENKNSENRLDGYSNQGILPDQCSTQQILESHLRKMASNSYDNYFYQTIPSLKNNVIVDYKGVMRYYHGYDTRHRDAYDMANKDYQEFANKSKAAVNILCKQFMTKKAARDSFRLSVNKTGVIDTVRMMNFHFTDDIFMRQTTMKKGKSHGLVFFMDWSGSMAVCLEDTLKQLFQIVLFCKRLNIPYEVYAFTSRFAELDNNKSDFEYPSDMKGSKMGFNNFSLLNILSSRMNGVDFNTMMRNLFVQINGYSRRSQYNYSIPPQMELSSTPLNEAVVAAMKIVPKFKQDNNLDIVHTVFLTDGETTGSSICGSSAYMKSFIIVGKKTYQVMEGTSSTDALYTAFSDITGCRSIGIFLDSRRRGGMSNIVTTRFFKNNQVLEKAKSTYDKEGFAVADKSCHGHDELFIIQGNASIEDDDLDEILSDKKSNVGIRNAFIKTMDKRTSSRVMLNRFIDLIAVE